MSIKSTTIVSLLSAMFAFPTYAVEKWPEGYFQADEAYNEAESVQKVWTLKSFVGQNAALDTKTLRFVTVQDSTSQAVFHVGLESCGKYRFPTGQARLDFHPLEILKKCKASSGDYADYELEIDVLRRSFSNILSQYQVDLSRPVIDLEGKSLHLFSESGLQVAVFKLDESAE